MGMFRFPADKRAKEATLDEQMKRVQSKTAEAIVAYMDNVEFGDEPLIDGTWQLIYAAEGILRKFPKEAVEESFERAREKAKSRGEM